MKKKYIIITFAVIFLLILYVKKCYDTNQPKGVRESLYRNASDKVTIRENGKVICEITGKEREELVSRLEDDGLPIVEGEPMSDDYTITLDFNNDLCLLYMSRDNRFCYINNKENQHVMNEKTYQFISRFL